MGHALNATISDILIRYHRMRGFATAWLPGIDHAGIAAQNVVEKNLRKENINRFDLGREKFIEKVWEWKEKYGNIILDQLKRIGASADWSRTRFTMDPAYSEEVTKAFIHYYNKGLIYRGKRIVNWCPRCQTSLSDLEIEYKEEAGKLFYIKYPLVLERGQQTESKDDNNVTLRQAQGINYIIVATTRPETMLGDAGVAVNPKDRRYKTLIGKSVRLPLVGRDIPIVADDSIDTKFGTGMVKVTPAHDMTDAEIGECHKLPIYEIINERGRMTDAVPEAYRGLKVAEAREKVVAELTTAGLVEKVEPYTHNVATCYRCTTTLEPLLSNQWFLKMAELAKKTAQAVKSKKTRIIPKNFEKSFFAWLKHIKDWCISRQIWWGHRIPVGYCVSCGDTVIEPKVTGNWFFVRHGETAANAEKRMQGQGIDQSLTSKGEEQARDAAKKLKGSNIDLIVSSDLKRAKETADIIAKELGVEVISDKRLRERNFGVLEGTTLEDRMKNNLTELFERRHHKGAQIPGAESVEEVEQRISEILAEHKEKHGHKNIVVISHGHTLRRLFGILKKLGADGIEELRFENASIAQLSVSKQNCKKCGGDFLELATDVLDTWFSSALWPFAGLNDADKKQFYPSNVLITARDIINLWVGRMIFSGLEFMGKTPFPDVLIHGTILTKDGKRMSKSLGTGIDPLQYIDQYGADATRFGIIWQTMGNQDIRWDEAAVMAGRKFANKIWNASRFVLGRVGNASTSSASNYPLSGAAAKSKGYLDTPRPKTAADKQILKKLIATKKLLEKQIASYELGPALHGLYDFFWHDFCDVYLEASKTQPDEHTNAILLHVLTASLKMLHLFMPHITEEIFQKLPASDSKWLIVEPW